MLWKKTDWNHFHKKGCIQQYIISRYTVLSIDFLVRKNQSFHRLTAKITSLCFWSETRQWLMTFSFHIASQYSIGVYLWVEAEYIKSKVLSRPQGKPKTFRLDLASYLSCKAQRILKSPKDTKVFFLLLYFPWQLTTFYITALCASQ